MNIGIEGNLNQTEARKVLLAIGRAEAVPATTDFESDSGTPILSWSPDPRAEKVRELFAAMTAATPDLPSSNL